MAYFGTLLNVQSATIAEKIKKLKDEIERIEQANREHRKIKHPAIRPKKYTKIAASGSCRFSRRSRRC